jgi:hypothetical protein
MFAAIEREIAVGDRAPVSASAEASVRRLPAPVTMHRTPRWLYRAAPALGAVALAAAALLMVVRQDNLPGDMNDAHSYETTVAAVGHSEVVQVDFGTNAGQVFDIPMSDGSSIPVVWIDDDDDDEE